MLGPPLLGAGADGTGVGRAGTRARTNRVLDVNGGVGTRTQSGAARAVSVRIAREARHRAGSTYPHVSHLTGSLEQ